MAKRNAPRAKCGAAGLAARSHAAAAVGSNLVLMRTLYGKTPSLTGFKKSTRQGAVASRGDGKRRLGERSIVVQGQIVALRYLRGDGTNDANTMERDRSRDGRRAQSPHVAPVRDVWQWRKCCELVPLDDGVLVALGGITVRCDGIGNVRWLRRHFAPPAEHRLDWVHQSFSPPLVIRDRAIGAATGRGIDRLPRYEYRRLDVVDSGLRTATHHRLRRRAGLCRNGRRLPRIRRLERGRALEGRGIATATHGGIASDRYVLYAVRTHDPENNRHVPYWVCAMRPTAANSRESRRLR